VAIKVLRDDRLGGAAAAARFRQEAQLAASFSHPNVVTVHDFGTIGTDRGYLVMELLDGVSLREELERRTRFDPTLALDILRGVAAAVEAAHARRIVHRDLKPENIVLVSAGPSWQPKVLDFGIAKILASSGGSGPRAETTGVLLGTPLYMAPEQLRGEDASPGWDLWAVAVIACEMLTGQHPFAGGPLPGGSHAGAFLTEAMVSSDLAALAPALARALALDPAARPASASALLSDLEAALKSR